MKQRWWKTFGKGEGGEQTSVCRHARSFRKGRSHARVRLDGTKSDIKNRGAGSEAGSYREYVERNYARCLKYSAIFPRKKAPSVAPFSVAACRSLPRGL